MQGDGDPCELSPFDGILPYCLVFLLHASIADLMLQGFCIFRSEADEVA